MPDPIQSSCVQIVVDSIEPDRLDLAPAPLACFLHPDHFCGQLYRRMRFDHVEDHRDLPRLFGTLASGSYRQVMRRPKRVDPDFPLRKQRCDDARRGRVARRCCLLRCHDQQRRSMFAGPGDGTTAIETEIVQTTTDLRDGDRRDVGLRRCALHLRAEGDGISIVLILNRRYPTEIVVGARQRPLVEFPSKYFWFECIGEWKRNHALHRHSRVQHFTSAQCRQSRSIPAARALLLNVQHRVVMRRCGRRRRIRR